MSKSITNKYREWWWTLKTALCTSKDKYINAATLEEKFGKYCRRLTREDIGKPITRVITSNKNGIRDISYMDEFQILLDFKNECIEQECEGCYRERTKDEPHFLTCGRCGSSYCSKICQMRDRKCHSTFCNEEEPLFRVSRRKTLCGKDPVTMLTTSRDPKDPILSIDNWWCIGWIVIDDDVMKLAAQLPKPFMAVESLKMFLEEYTGWKEGHSINNLNLLPIYQELIPEKYKNKYKSSYAEYGSQVPQSVMERTTKLCYGCTSCKIRCLIEEPFIKKSYSHYRCDLDTIDQDDPAFLLDRDIELEMELRADWKIYKRSLLQYGHPGGGKSSLVDMLSFTFSSNPSEEIIQEHPISDSQTTYASDLNCERRIDTSKEWCSTLEDFRFESKEISDQIALNIAKQFAILGTHVNFINIVKRLAVLGLDRIVNAKSIKDMNINTTEDIVTQTYTELSQIAEIRYTYRKWFTWGLVLVDSYMAMNWEIVAVEKFGHIHRNLETIYKTTIRKNRVNKTIRTFLNLPSLVPLICLNNNNPYC